MLIPGKLYSPTEELVAFTDEALISSIGEHVLIPPNSILMFIENKKWPKYDSPTGFDEYEGVWRCLSFVYFDGLINFIYCTDYRPIANKLKRIL